MGTINIRIIKEGKQFVAIDESTTISDYGDSVVEALANLKETLDEHIKAFGEK